MDSFLLIYIHTEPHIFEQVRFLMKLDIMICCLLDDEDETTYFSDFWNSEMDFYHQNKTVFLIFSSYCCEISFFFYKLNNLCNVIVTSTQTKSQGLFLLIFVHTPSPQYWWIPTSSSIRSSNRWVSYLHLPCISIMNNLLRDFPRPSLS